MDLDPETQNWVDEMKKHGAIDDDLRPFLARVEMSEPLRTALKGSVSATKDYKRKMDLLAKQEKDAKDLVEANTRLQEELVRWQKSEVEPTLAKANKIMTEQAALKAKIGERAKVLKDKYGVEDEDISDLLQETVVTRKEAVTRAGEKGAEVNDEVKFVKSDDFDKLSRATPRLVARIEKIGRQFDKLFTGTDKEFDPDAVLDLAEKEKLTVDAAFSKLYDVSARQKELSDQAKEKEFQERLTKERAQWEAKMGAQGPQSPRADEGGAFLTEVLKRDKKGSGEPPAKAPDPIDLVRQASRSTAPADAVSRYVAKFRQQEYKSKGIPVETGA